MQNWKFKKNQIKSNQIKSNQIKSNKKLTLISNILGWSEKDKQTFFLGILKIDKVLAKSINSN